MNVNIPDVDSGDDGSAPLVAQRQIFFLGLGMFGAILMINVVFLFSYTTSNPRISALRVLGPAVTVVFSLLDLAMMRNLCRRQFAKYPQLLSKWPVNLPSYPTWVYSLFLVGSIIISGYLLSRL